MRMKQPVRTKKPARAKGVPRFTRALGTPAMIALVFSVMSAAILIAVSRPAPATQRIAVSVPGDLTSERDGSGRASSEKKSGATTAAVATASMMARADSATDTDTEAVATATAGKASPVTITGCLQAEQYAFVLKNTAGEDVPKARSLKSGFLKKGPAAIEVVDASRRLKLPAHVGQRVSVTGTLVGREMQVRSLQRVASSCNQKS